MDPLLPSIATLHELHNALYDLLPDENGVVDNKYGSFRRLMVNIEQALQDGRATEEITVWYTSDWKMISQL